MGRGQFSELRSRLKALWAPLHPGDALREGPTDVFNSIYYYFSEWAQGGLFVFDFLFLLPTDTYSLLLLRAFRKNLKRA